MANKRVHSGEDILNILEDSDVEIHDSDLEHSESDESLVELSDDELDELFYEQFASEDEVENHVDDSWISGPRGVSRLPFSGKVGLNVDISSSENILEIFNCFFTEDMLEIIVEQTNNYASKFVEASKENQPTHSRAKSWEPTDSNEVMCFLALIILQGLVSKPTIFFGKRSY